MDDRKKLDALLVDVDEIEKIEARVARFNILQVLRVEDAEIRHSNILAWLLDPLQSHGLKGAFLHRFLTRVLLNAEVPGLSVAQVGLFDFGEVEVRREWEHADILVVDWKNKLTVLIENKVHCGESPGALARYLEKARLEFPDHVVLPVFLTLDGMPSTEVEEYIASTHLQVLGVLDSLLARRQDSMSDEVYVFLTHYADTLRRITMQDTELEKLCRDIYRKHGAAIDLIYQCGRYSTFKEAVIEKLKKAGDFEVLYRGLDWVVFMPMSWVPLVPVQTKPPDMWSRFDRPVTIACWLLHDKGKVQLVFEMSTMDDPAIRLKYVSALDEKGPLKFKTKKAFETGTTYSRFYTQSQKVSERADEEEVADAITSLLAKAKDAVSVVAGILQKVKS